MNKDAAADERATPSRVSTSARPSLRADARRNRDELLRAARELFAEQGPDAPLEDIARRAGVGIGTLYRRFPDRQALLHAVALDVLTQVAEEARLALAEEPDAFRALARYMHRALDARISAVMPGLAEQLPREDAQLRQARAAITASVQTMLQAAQAEGTLRADIAFGDISLLLVRLARPLPGPIPLELDSRLAHRQLELLLAGLRAAPSLPPAPLPAPALTLADLHALGKASDRTGPENEPALERSQTPPPEGA